jgi:hypothetical protein
MHSFVQRRGLEESIGHGAPSCMHTSGVYTYAKKVANDPWESTAGVHSQCIISLKRGQGYQIMIISSLEIPTEQIATGRYIYILHKYII